jgi:hypothetical protein
MTRKTIKARDTTRHPIIPYILVRMGRFSGSPRSKVVVGSACVGRWKESSGLTRKLQLPPLTISALPRGSERRPHHPGPKHDQSQTTTTVRTKRMSAGMYSSKERINNTLQLFSRRERVTKATDTLGEAATPAAPNRYMEFDGTWAGGVRLGNRG